MLHAGLSHHLDTTTPGRLVVVAVGLWLAVTTRASGLAARPQPAGVRVEVISQPLGLVEITDTRPAQSPPRLTARAASRTITTDLRLDDRGLWVARVMLAGASAPLPAGEPIALSLTHDGTTDSWSAPLRPAVITPDWAKGAVWCQIMPERFDNGSPLNDPRQPGTFRPAWNSPWRRVRPAELETGWASAASLGYTLDPDQPGGMLYNLVWHRRFGGDLQGVVDRLDHLQTLGITALYCTPVFHAESMHKYGATDYRHIDPTLGSTGLVPVEPTPDQAETTDPATWRWTDADAYFLGVVLPEARGRAMRVIIDGVWNHTGLDFWAFRDALEHGRGSRYARWYDFRFDDTGRVVSWGAWDKPNGHLPRFARRADGDLIEPVRDHVFDITTRWMDPNGDGDPADGIDGWRLDVAGEIAPVFWKQWRTLVKSINPDAALVGELWHRADGLLAGDAFDAQMNYPFAYEITGWLGLRPGMTSADLARGLRLAQTPHASVGLCQMNLLDSHDVERVWSMLANPGRAYDRGARLMDGDTYDESPPSDQTIARGLLAYALIATLEGAPMLYAGDEFAMRGADDPDNRRPIPWPDKGPYADDDRPRPEVAERIGAWFRLRQDPTIGPILRFGGTRYLDSGEADIFVVERFLNNRSAVVVVNRSENAFDAAALVDPARADRAGGTRLVIPPMTARWWLRVAGP